MNPLWLILIIPVAFSAGVFFVGILLAASDSRPL